MRNHYNGVGHMKTQPSAPRSAVPAPIVKPSNDVIPWIRQARPGDSMVYFTGKLDFHRYGNADVPGPLAAEICTIADAFYRAYVEGYLHLTQRRIGALRYEYTATRRERAFRRN
jgi:hypothetical protein